MLEGAVTISEDEKSFSANNNLFDLALDGAAGILEGKSMEELIGSRKILVSEKNNLPPYLARGIIGDRKPAEEFSEMPDDMRFKVRVEFPSLFSTCPPTYYGILSEIASKRLSIVYREYITAAARPARQPLFQVDGVTVLEDIVGYIPGASHTVNVSLFRPGVDQWEASEKRMIAGSRANVCLTTQKTSALYIQEKIRELEELKNNSGLGPDDTMTPEMVDGSLRLTGMMYFMLLDYIENIVSKQTGIVPVNHVSLAFIVDDIIPIGFWFIIIGTKKGGAHIDVVRSANNPVSTTGNAEDRVRWMQVCGGFSSNMEHTILETMYDIEAVSTGKIFSEASKLGIPIHVIKSETLEEDLAQVSANYAIKDHIRTCLTDETREFEALIPQRGITLGSWSGQGWIIMEPSTGAAGYMICGGLHSNMILNGGSLIEKLNNALFALHKLLSTAEGIAQALIVGATSALSAGVHAYAALLLIGAGTIAGAFIAAYFVIMAVAITYVTVMIYIWLLTNAMQQARFIPTRRRKLAYIV
ncbi:MAG: hypothetical protein ACNY01_13340 [Desulfobacteria bacterium]